jgi:hypothetical protein
VAQSPAGREGVATEIVYGYPGDEEAKAAAEILRLEGVKVVVFPYYERH